VVVCECSQEHEALGEKVGLRVYSESRLMEEDMRQARRLVIMLSPMFYADSPTIRSPMKIDRTCEKERTHSRNGG
jgi:hypothetical protein